MSTVKENLSKDLQIKFWDSPRWHVKRKHKTTRLLETGNHHFTFALAPRSLSPWRAVLSQQLMLWHNCKKTVYQGWLRVAMWSIWVFKHTEEEETWFRWSGHWRLHNFGILTSLPWPQVEGKADKTADKAPLFFFCRMNSAWSPWQGLRLLALIAGSSFLEADDVAKEVSQLMCCFSITLRRMSNLLDIRWSRRSRPLMGIKTAKKTVASM